MTVIANGLVPIQPYKTNVLNIAMGQRYNVIGKVDQVSVAKNFRLQCLLGKREPNQRHGNDILRWLASTPSTTGYSFTDSCVDEDMSNLTPIVSETVFSPFYNKSEAVSLGKNGGSLYRWKLNSTSMHVNWTDSTLWGVYRGHRSWTNTSGVVELPHNNVWTYVVIEMSMSVPHPIHLHGHDVVVLAQESGTVTRPCCLKIDTWSSHSKQTTIGWHTEEGFAIQFVKRYNEIKPLIDYDNLHANCQTWDAFENRLNVEEDDSGI
ncbi:hypothetical protein N7499_009019 [Penicillium canescens]|uniref:Plastocyanin-like domain-containing protein n=1 Tax=Penicillium canescens TaxID=5083 RepID=A0AAD6I1A8_PENCN|nr:uncharacterized protein N7446_013987 [Penicillium canescens]KAJ6023623.1 hypothetical protein N7460_014018 [Penicillium canescens]KAJ6025099.1 hypothetical protein N7444_012778 [Penicillium canescens]KAJ6042921.1 hypothetical protein N7446_013987 [Penicillium canescens]KAJ6077038.1 hypothetical protein N7499_009019 [Penicillium canescens]KAJ6159350.1 hypothetical protein N7485_012176 [Penicillium canescens]